MELEELFKKANYKVHKINITKDYEEYINPLPFSQFPFGKNIIFQNKMVYCPTTLSVNEVVAIYEKIKEKGWLEDIIKVRKNSLYGEIQNKE